MADHFKFDDFHIPYVGTLGPGVGVGGPKWVMKNYLYRELLLHNFVSVFSSAGGMGGLPQAVEAVL